MGKIYSSSLFPSWDGDSVKKRNRTPPPVWIFLFFLCMLLNILILHPFCWGKWESTENQPSSTKHWAGSQFVSALSSCIKVALNQTERLFTSVWKWNSLMGHCTFAWHFQTRSSEFLLCNYSSTQIARSLWCLFLLVLFWFLQSYCVVCSFMRR